MNSITQSLAPYRGRRGFAWTSGPRGDSEGPGAHRPVFRVRLAAECVLRSWAVPNNADGHEAPLTGALRQGHASFRLHGHKVRDADAPTRIRVPHRARPVRTSHTPGRTRRGTR